MVAKHLSNELYGLPVNEMLFRMQDQIKNLYELIEALEAQVETMIER
jgi:hypothetical protein